ncbi:hypothetical protein QJS10_CPB18g01489 [Acorus calamus]|uniref:C2H2-type domain-containing protein n=1 Tax=Acorus calamus TaxID=4465 RepID=A0AAV9CPG0_ACOCL|nr:hypothetical protein QJS10_CPB18g01489 [Acorus calamus]
MSELVEKNSNVDLREKAASVTLREVHSQGHTYVDLRNVGKRIIFCCTLCRADCFSDSALFDHLNGKVHARRYAAAEVTLMGPLPWPFNDGVLFFTGNNSCDRLLTNGNSNGSMDTKNSLIDDRDQRMVIRDVLLNNELSTLKVRFIGHGHIAVRDIEIDACNKWLSRIWCAWLGEGDDCDKDMLSAPKSDFSIITFSYTYDLGVICKLKVLENFLSSGCHSEGEDYGSSCKKRRKSLLEYYSGTSDCAPKTVVSASDGEYDRLSTRALRKELRKQKQLVAERMCDICLQPIIPQKDVATLFNSKTGRLACSSRNTKGAFHVFHTSCLIHWILLCEFEMLINNPNGMKRNKGRKNPVSRKEYKDQRLASQASNWMTTETPFSSVFCPECQGTGVDIKGDELEKERCTIPLSEMFHHKIKASESHKAWMKSPELIDRCSTGLHFPCGAEGDFQEIVNPLKLIRFYRAEE